MMRKIITEHTLRSLIRNVLLEQEGPDSVTTRDSVGVSVGTQKGSKNVSGGRTQITRTANADGKIIYTDVALGLQIKQQLLSLHESIGEVVKKEGLKYFRIYDIKQDSIQNIKYDKVDMSGNDSGSRSFYSDEEKNKFNPRSILDRVSNPITGRKKEVLQDQQMSVGGFRESLTNALQRLQDEGIKLRGLNIHEKNTYRQLKVIFEDYGVMSEDTCKLLKIMFASKAFIRVFQMIAGNIKEGASIDIDKLLMFYLSFSGMNASQVIASSGLIENQSDYDKWYNKLKVTADTRAAKELTAYIMGLGESGRKWQDIDFKFNNIEDRIMFQLAFFVDLNNYLKGSVNNKEVNFDAAGLYTLVEFLLKCCLGAYNFFSIMTQMSFRTEQQKVEQLETMISEESTETSRFVTENLLKIFTGLDVVVIEGISQLVSEEFFKIETSQLDTAKIKAGREVIKRYKKKVKQGNKPVTCKVPVPVKCCGNTIMQFNLLGNNNVQQ